MCFYAYFVGCVLGYNIYSEDMSIRGALGALFVVLVLLTEVSAQYRANGQIYVSDIIAPGQKWHNYDTSVLLEIEKVNTKNATFAGTYRIIRDGTISRFPFRGEFDPIGITIGWVVSYWNNNINDHALGSWAGYARIQANDQRASMSMTRLIAHEDNSNTTTGYDTFILDSN